MRQHDLAILEARKALELDPDYPFAYGELGLAYSQMGAQKKSKDMHDKAIAELQEGLKRGKSHPNLAGLLGYAYALAGQEVEARKMLEKLKEPNPRYGAAFAITRIYAALGEKDQAFEWLRKACDERVPYVIWIKVDPTMDNLRKEPKFAEILKEMQLPP
jgi:tetratricopeptide (TPR) repeat protein